MNTKKRLPVVSAREPLLLSFTSVGGSVHPTWRWVEQGRLLPGQSGNKPLLERSTDADSVGHPVGRHKPVLATASLPRRTLDYVTQRHVSMGRANRGAVHKHRRTQKRGGRRESR